MTGPSLVGPPGTRPSTAAANLPEAEAEAERAGPARTGASGPGSTETGAAGTERAGTERGGTERAGTEGGGTERAGTERAGTEPIDLDGSMAGASAGQGRVVVCLGPGGVGKTTTAAALALLGARRGDRACVVTVDPARRLADALGISDVGNDPHEVVPPEGTTWDGELWAVMLDAQKTFDDLVDRYAADADQAGAIFSNPVYKNMSASLSGTQEYMAVEKLYELQESGRFDLIVVDTPPSQHALDFLEAPGHLARLLDNRVFRLLMTPTRLGLRAIELGAQLMLRTIAKVAGGQVVADTVQFFTEFEGMEQGFRQRAERAQQLLRSPLTSFTLVCTPRRDTVDDALNLVAELSRAAAAVDGVVVNRCYPRFEPLSEEMARSLSATALAPLVTNLAQLALVGAKEDEQLARVEAALPHASTWRVPFLPTEVCDLASLQVVAGYLEQPEQG